MTTKAKLPIVAVAAIACAAGWLARERMAAPPAASSSADRLEIELGRLSDRMETLARHRNVGGTVEPNTDTIRHIVQDAVRTALEQTDASSSSEWIEDGLLNDDEQETADDDITGMRSENDWEDAAREAHGMVDEAIDAQAWTPQQATAFRDLLAQVPHDEAYAIRGRLAGAVNEGRVQLSQPFLPF